MLNKEMLTGFFDELRKMGAGNYASPMSMGQGSNIVTQPAFPTSGINKPSPAVKPTNYSIVHNQSPMAADTSAPASSKAEPPPPVRT